MTMTMTRDHVDQITPANRPDDRGRRRFRRSIAGLAAAGALAGVGTALLGNANYSDRYVSDQLARQRITFKAAAALTDAERARPCVVENAGKPLLIGRQAESYANDFIGTHVVAIGKGRTYAEMENVRTDLTARIAAAQASGDAELPRLQEELGELTGQREALFRAEMLRGALLTSFGFSSLGEKAAQGATATYGAAGIVTLLSLAGLIRARQ
jgi:hypothetical protein